MPPLLTSIIYSFKKVGAGSFEATGRRKGRVGPLTKRESQTRLLLTASGDPPRPPRAHPIQLMSEDRRSATHRTPASTLPLATPTTVPLDLSRRPLRVARRDLYLSLPGLLGTVSESSPCPFSPGPADPLALVPRRLLSITRKTSRLQGELGGSAKIRQDWGAYVTCGGRTGWKCVRKDSERVPKEQMNVWKEWRGAMEVS
jgi:hypothetical protein